MKSNRFLLIYSFVLLIGIGILLYFKYTSFKSKILRIAKAELNKWKGLSELSTQATGYLLDYWKSVGFNFTPQQMQSKDVQSAYPWSSAFISFLFLKAGANSRFPYSSSHSGYFQQAKANRNNKNASLRGFRINEYAPKVGDIVVYSRKDGAGYDTNGYFPAHGELVIEKGKNYIKAIGGNVSNTVKISTYMTDQKGMLSNGKVPFFMVIENNIK